MRVKGKTFKNQDASEYHIYLCFDATTEERSGIEARLPEAKNAPEGKKKDKNRNLVRTYGKHLSIETHGTEKDIRKVSVNSAGVDAMPKDMGYDSGSTPRWK